MLVKDIKLHCTCTMFLTQTQTPILIPRWEVSDVEHFLPFLVHLLRVSFSPSVLVNLHDIVSFHNQFDVPKNIPMYYIQLYPKLTCHTAKL